MDLPDMDDQKMTLYDWFDDLCVRFIINLPHEELSSIERICFQVEEAQWFYEDFIRPLDPSLPSMNLRTFCLRFFDHCPIFANFTEHHYLAAFTEFLAYKSRVPVRGAILLNETMDHVVLVKGWKKGAKWSFPRGKINLGEKDLDCAIREVYEETGFDVRQAGLVEDESQTKFIEVSMREQHMRLYVFRGVKMDTHFEPRTRKEISKIGWWKISELPTFRKQKNPHGTSHAAQIAQQIEQQDDMAKSNLFYMVAPFLGPLKNWIRQKKKVEAVRNARADTRESEPADEVDDVPPSDNPLVVESEPLPQVVEQAPFATNPGDMDRIFAQLRQSRPNSQAHPAVVHPTDPAEALKKILSIGGTHESALPPSQGSSRATDLLALFNRDAQNGSVAITPVTPFEQLSLTPDARTPYHHHSNQHVFPDAAPPPQFHQPVPPIHQQMHRPDQAQQLMQHPSRQGPRNPFVPDQVQRQLGAMPPPGSIPPAQSTSQLPYRHTGDPQFTQFAGLHSPAVPSASDLPQPRLNNHTMALLNAFRGPAKPEVDTERYVTSHDGPIAHPDEANHPPHNPPDPSSSKQQQALLNLFKARPGAGKPPQRAQPPQIAAIPPEPVELSAQPTPIVHQQRHTPPPAIQTKKALQQTKRQNRGITSATVSGPLNTPAFDTVRRSSSRRTSGQMKPAELASVQSPNSDEPGQFPSTGTIKILARPGSSSAKQPAGRPSLESTPPPMQYPSQQIPIEAPQPKAAHQQYLQILRPPRVQPSAPSSAQGMGSPPSGPSLTSSAQGNDTPGAHEQKNTLLNLFMKHTAHTHGPGATGGSITGQTPTLSPPQFQREPTASTIISPISPHPASMHAAIDPVSANRSRISSLASASGETFLSTIPGNLPGAATAGHYGHPVHSMKPPPTSAGIGSDPAGAPAASRKSSTAAGPSRKGSAAEGWPPRGQSPVTPTDRNFLLGYLEGVVKGAGV